ncbi:unnamed protein product, partial [marine sediment metagenome]
FYLKMVFSKGFNMIFTPLVSVSKIFLSEIVKKISSGFCLGAFSIRFLLQKFK